MTAESKPERGQATDRRKARRRRSAVAFVGRPRITIGPDGVPRVTFSIVNDGPASVEVSFDVRIDGRTVRVEDPSLSLGASSGVRSVTLDLPWDTEVGRFPRVTVAAKNADGVVLAVGTGGFGLVLPLLAGAIAVSGLAWVAWEVLDPDAPSPGTGDVQVTLEWSEPVDLDLHVTDPAGETISFRAPESTSGGELDLDACAALANCSAGQHVENVFWPVGAAPEGDYTALVDHFNGSDPADYELTVRTDGQLVDTIVGTLQPGETSSAYAFAR